MVKREYKIRAITAQHLLSTSSYPPAIHQCVMLMSLVDFYFFFHLFYCGDRGRGESSQKGTQSPICGWIIDTALMDIIMI